MQPRTSDRLKRLEDAERGRHPPRLAVTVHKLDGSTEERPPKEGPGLALAIVVTQTSTPPDRD